MADERGILSLGLESLEAGDFEVGVTQHVECGEGTLLSEVSTSCVKFEELGVEWPYYPPVDLTLDYWSCYAPPAPIVVTYGAEDRYAEPAATETLKAGQHAAGVTQTFFFEEQEDLLTVPGPCAGFHSDDPDWFVYPLADVTLEYWACYEPPVPIAVDYGVAEERHAVAGDLDSFETTTEHRIGPVQDVVFDGEFFFAADRYCATQPDGQAEWPIYAPSIPIILDYFCCYDPGLATAITVDYGEAYDREALLYGADTFESATHEIGQSSYITPDSVLGLEADQKACVTDGSENDEFFFYPPPSPIILDYYSCYAPPVPITASYYVYGLINRLGDTDTFLAGEPFVGMPFDQELVVGDNSFFAAGELQASTDRYYSIGDSFLFESSEPALHVTFDITVEVGEGPGLEVGEHTAHIAVDQFIEPAGEETLLTGPVEGHIPWDQWIETEGKDTLEPAHPDVIDCVEQQVTPEPGLTIKIGFPGVMKALLRTVTPDGGIQDLSDEHIAYHVTEQFVQQPYGGYMFEWAAFGFMFPEEQEVEHSQGLELLELGEPAVNLALEQEVVYESFDGLGVEEPTANLTLVQYTGFESANTFEGEEPKAHIPWDIWIEPAGRNMLAVAGPEAVLPHTRRAYIEPADFLEVASPFLHLAFDQEVEVGDATLFETALANVYIPWEQTAFVSEGEGLETDSHKAHLTVEQFVTNPNWEFLETGAINLHLTFEIGVEVGDTDTLAITAPAKVEIPPDQSVEIDGVELLLQHPSRIHIAVEQWAVSPVLDGFADGGLEANLATPQEIFHSQEFLLEEVSQDLYIHPPDQLVGLYAAGFWEPGQHSIENFIDVHVFLVTFGEQRVLFSSGHDTALELQDKEVIVGWGPEEVEAGKPWVYYAEGTKYEVGGDSFFELDDATISLYRRFVGFGEQEGLLETGQHSLVFDQYAEIPWEVHTRYGIPAVVRHLDILQQGYLFTEYGDIESGFGNVLVTKGAETLDISSPGVRNHVIEARFGDNPSTLLSGLFTRVWNELQVVEHLDGNEGAPQEKTEGNSLVLNVDREVRPPALASLRTGDLFDTVGRLGHPVHLPGDSTWEAGEPLVAFAVRSYEIPSISEFRTSSFTTIENAAFGVTPESVDTDDIGVGKVWRWERSFTLNGQLPLSVIDSPWVSFAERTVEVKGDIQPEFKSGLHQTGLLEIFVEVEEYKQRPQQGFTIKGYPVPSLVTKPCEGFEDGGAKEVVNRNKVIVPFGALLTKDSYHAVDLSIRNVEVPGAFLFAPGAKSTVADSTRKVSLIGNVSLETGWLNVRNEILDSPRLIQAFIWDASGDFPEMLETGPHSASAPQVVFGNGFPFTEIDEPWAQGNTLHPQNPLDFMDKPEHTISLANRVVEPEGPKDDALPGASWLFGPLNNSFGVNSLHSLSIYSIWFEIGCDFFNTDIKSTSSGADCAAENYQPHSISLQHRTVFMSASWGLHTQYGEHKAGWGTHVIKPDSNVLTTYGWFVTIPYNQRLWAAPTETFEPGTQTLEQEHVPFDVSVSIGGSLPFVQGLFEIQNQHREVTPDAGIVFLWGDNEPMVHFEREIVPEPTDTDLHYENNRLSHDPQYPQIDEGPLLEETRWESAPWVFSFWREGMLYPFSAETEKYGRPDIRRAA